MPHTLTHHPNGKRMQTMHECHTICMEMIQYCLQQGGKHAGIQHIRLLQDCSEVCQTGENFMTRVSNQFDRLSGTCADLCERTAQACDQFGGDRQMQRCAEACRACADACRKMAKMVA